MDIVLLVLCMFLGICFGIFTGLLPGVHINLIAGMILIYLSFFLKFFDEVFLGVFIIVMSVTHTFIDFIPSIIFGVPSTDTAMGVLPGHRLVLEGKGYLAIFLSSIGSLFGVIFLFFLLPVLFLYLDIVYLFAHDYIAYVLILVVVFLIFQDFGDKNKFFWSFIIVCFSSVLGFLVLNTYLIDDALLVLFTGLFGVASLVFALNEGENSLPLQKFDLGGFKIDFSFFKAVFVGGVTSSVCSVVPGVGNAQAATIVSVFFKKMSAELFIVMLSVINTINFALSIVTFYLISRARNGSILVVSQILGEINLGLLWFYLIIILIVAIFCFFITIFLGKLILKGIARINLRYVNIFILGSLFLIVFSLTNFYGVLILVLSSSLGLLALGLGVKRIHLMSVLLVPVIFNLL